MVLSTERRTRRFALLCALLMLCAAGASALAGQTEAWYIAYRRYVTDGIYLLSFPDEFFPDTSEPITFALHDMNKDKVPELIIGNGNDSEAGHVSLFFSREEGSVAPLGVGGPRLGMDFMYTDDPQFPGLFYQNGNMGYYPLYYYSVENDILVEETVYVDEVTVNADDTETKREIRETADDALYAAAHGAMQTLPRFTRQDIAENGWAWFVSQYPALCEGENR